MVPPSSGYYRGVELRTEIEISAPPSKVWAVLTDFYAYPDWNPFLVRVSGKPEAGAKLTIVAAMPGGRDWTLRPTILKVEPERELRWLGRLLLPGIFDGEHFFKVVDLGGDRSRFMHGEDFSGVLVRFASGMLTDTARGFVYMNQALKRRVEQDGARPRAS
jgi:hypothetical protein